MEGLKDEFVSHERRHFKYNLGKLVASSLSGFLAGIIVTVIFILTLFDIVLKK
jgi:hypothetical protein